MYTTVRYNFIENLWKLEYSSPIYKVENGSPISNQTEIVYDPDGMCTLLFAAVSFEIWGGRLFRFPIMTSRLDLSLSFKPNFIEYCCLVITTVL